VTWVSDDDFAAEIARLGVTASAKQMENWRLAGLAPQRRQIPDKYRGSRVLHASTEAIQYLAVERALQTTNRLDFAGFAAWAIGLDVDERYWRPHVDKGDRLITKAGNSLRRIMAYPRDGPTLGDRFVASRIVGGIIGKMRRRLEGDELANVVNIGVDIVTGDFEHFSHEPVSEAKFTSQSSAMKALGFLEGINDHVYGQSIGFQTTIEGSLSDLTAAIPHGNEDAISIGEILAARDDLRNGLKTAFCLYHGISWIYGPQAFGLRLGAYIAEHRMLDLIAVATIPFARLRRASNDLMASLEIAKMARDAERLWIMSNVIRDMRDSDENLREMFSPSRLKMTLTDTAEQNNLLKELAGYHAATPDVRPWAYWLRHAKRTMKPGLLVMSFGAPETLLLPDLLAGVNADPNLSSSAGTAST